jgi:hypothetical protein
MVETVEPPAAVDAAIEFTIQKSQINYINYINRDHIISYIIIHII